MKIKIIPTLISAAVLSTATTSVWAAGTLADTQIDNKATISYSVSGTAQTDIESSAGGNSNPGTGNGGDTSFKVDKKIDLTVTADAGPFSAVPSSTNSTVTYKLKNEGNSQEFFLLSATQVAGDNFDTSSCSYTSSIGSVTGTNTLQLAADAEPTITVTCTIPPSTSVGDGDTSDLDLNATAVTNTGGGTAYTESATDSVDPLVVDVVLADGIGTGASPTDTIARNASHSAVNTFTVGTATLEVTKASEVYSDPLNSTTNPKRIPGAVIKYTITVVNTGSVSATSLIVADHIPSNMTYADATTTPVAPAGCVASDGSACVLDGALSIGSPAVIAPGISATGMTVANGATETVIFYASVD